MNKNTKSILPPTQARMRQALRGEISWATFEREFTGAFRRFTRYVKRTADRSTAADARRAERNFTRCLQLGRGHN